MNYELYSLKIGVIFTDYTLTKQASGHFTRPYIRSALYYIKIRMCNYLTFAQSCSNTG